MMHYQYQSQSQAKPRKWDRGNDLPHIMMEKVRHSSDDHKCQLPLLEERIADTSYFWDLHPWTVKTHKFLKRMMYVDRRHPMSKQVFRSSAGIDAEKHRQLELYVIHPFSRFTFAWRSCMLLVNFVMICLVIPFTVFLPHTPDGCFSFLVILEVICLLDIVIVFWTGCYDTKHQNVILKGKERCWRYFRTTLFFDFFGSIPYQSVIEICPKDTTGDRMADIAYLKYFAIFKLVKILQLKSDLDNICSRFKVTRSGFLMVYFIMLLAEVVMGLATIKTAITFFARDHVISLIFENHNQIAYLLSLRLHRLLMEILQIGHQAGDVVTLESDLIMISHFLFMALGAICGPIIFVKMSQIYNRGSSSKGLYNQYKNETSEYMKFKGLSPELQTRINTFLRFKFSGQNYKEKLIMNTLSESLKEDVLFHQCEILVQNVDCFRDVPRHVLLSLMERFRTDVYLNGDLIYEEGKTGNAMYFISRGTVAVYQNSVEIAHLTEGDNFGEAAILWHRPRYVTVCAITECELFKLTTKDFSEALDPFPDLLHKVREAAYEKLVSGTAVDNGGFGLADSSTRRKTLHFHI